MADFEERPSKTTDTSVWVRDTDLSTRIKQQYVARDTLWSTLVLAYGSLGVIYGDIGTSVIYVFPAIFEKHQLSIDYDDLKIDIYGAISLIFWTLTLIALFKYIFIVLSANDTGEGGTVALYALLCRTMGISPYGTMKAQDFKQVQMMTSAAPTGPRRPKLGEHRFKETAKESRSERQKAKKAKPSRPPIFRPMTTWKNMLVLDGTNVIRWFRTHLIAQRCLLLTTMFATGLVVGDGILMPAFSVVSSISGLRGHTSIDTDGDIIGISIAIIVVLFLFQHVGTKKIGFLFTPIIILWLLANLSIGIYNLHTYGGAVFQGLSPHYIVLFFEKWGKGAWEMLSGVLLCVTGTETMFAAMGHFSKGSIALAFGCLTYPCVMITYLGQGAFLMVHPELVDQTFWESIPSSIFWPMLVLATAAAVVASQAVITGTFSLIRQAMAMGIHPKLRVIHTGDVVEGQIFIPVINYALMLLCVAVVAGFDGDNIRLANAYGVAVIFVMLITTWLVTLIMVTTWEVTLLLVVPFWALFSLIEGGFLSAALMKVPQGAWFALAVSLAFALIMVVWWLGSLWRRRVLVASSKQTAAQDLFRVHKSVGSRGGKSSAAGSFTTLEQPNMLMVEGVTVSAAGYAAYTGMGDDTGNLTAELMGAFAAGAHKGLKKGEDRVSFGRTSAPIGARPMLGRFSTSHATSGAAVGRFSMAPGLLSSTKAPAPTGRPSAPQPPSFKPASGSGVAEPAPAALLDSGPINLDAPPPTDHKTAMDAAIAAMEAEAQSSFTAARKPKGAASAASPTQGSPTLPAPPSPGGRPGGPQPIAEGTEHPPAAAGGGIGAAAANAVAAVDQELAKLAKLAAAATKSDRGAKVGVSFAEEPAKKAAPPKLGSVSMSTPAASGPSKSSLKSGGDKPQLINSQSSLALQTNPEQPLALLSGLGMYYSDSPVGIPPVMRHFLRNVDAMHEVVIFLTVRFLPMPTIKHSERLLVRAVFGMPNFYQVVARYGYQDIVDHRPAFMSQVVATLLHKLELKAGLKYRGLEDDFIHELEGDDVDDDGGHGGGNTGTQGTGIHQGLSNSPFGLPSVNEANDADRPSYSRVRSRGIVRERDLDSGIPIMTTFIDEAMKRMREVAAQEDAPQAALDALEAAEALVNAYDEAVVYYLGRTWTRSRKGNNMFRSLLVGSLFRTMELLAFTDSEAWSIPLDNMVELGMCVEI